MNRTMFIWFQNQYNIVNDSRVNMNVFYAYILALDATVRIGIMNDADAVFNDFIYRVVNMRCSANDMTAELLDGLLSCDFGECMKPCSQGDIGYAKSLMGVARNELSMDDFRLFIWMRTMNAYERDAPVLARNNMLAMFDDAMHNEIAYIMSHGLNAYRFSCYHWLHDIK